MLARFGVLDEADGGFAVVVGSGEPLPEGMPADPEELAARMAARYAHGSNEIGLFRRSANALPDVLRGRMDPLTMLFSSGEPTAADLYMKAPVARAANRMLADAIAALLSALTANRRLRVLEVGADTGSAIAAVLPELPDVRFDYTYTDISAGFFGGSGVALRGSGGGHRLPGAGQLGLSLVAAVVQFHEASLTLEDNAPVPVVRLQFDRVG